VLRRRDERGLGTGPERVVGVDACCSPLDGVTDGTVVHSGIGVHDDEVLELTYSPKLSSCASLFIDHIVWAPDRVAFRGSVTDFDANDIVLRVPNPGISLTARSDSNVELS